MINKMQNEEIEQKILDENEEKNNEENGSNSINHDYLGWIASSTKLVIEDAKLKLIQTIKDSSVTPGSFIVIEDPKNSEIQYLAVILNSSLKSLYRQSPYDVVLCPDNFQFPAAHFESIQLHEVEILAVREGPDFFGPGKLIQPDSQFRRPSRDELLNFFKIDRDKPYLPTILTTTDGKFQRDLNSAPIIIPIHLDGLLTGVTLLPGQPGSGKTETIGNIAWSTTNIFQFEGRHGAFITLNNKGIDLLYLDQPRSKVDPQWSELGLQPQGIHDFQIITPSNSECQRRNAHIIRYTFDTSTFDPEALLGITQFGELGELFLPDIFRHFQRTEAGTMVEFIEHLENLPNIGNNRVLAPTMTPNGQIHNTQIHSATLSSVISRLNIIAQYFDDPSGCQVDASDLIQPGRCSVIDTVMADEMYASLCVRQVMTTILKNQQTVKRERGPLIPIVFAIDEAHLIYSNDKVTGNTINTIAKLGRNLKIGIVVASQLVSKLNQELIDLAGIKMIFRLSEGEAHKLGVPKLAQPRVQKLLPGHCLLIDNVDLRQTFWIKFPLAPCEVKGE